DSRLVIIRREDERLRAVDGHPGIVAAIIIKRFRRHAEAVLDAALLHQRAHLPETRPMLGLLERREFSPHRPTSFSLNNMRRSASKLTATRPPSSIDGGSPRLSARHTTPDASSRSTRCQLPPKMTERTVAPT